MTNKTKEKIKRILTNLSAEIEIQELKLKHSFCRNEVVKLLNEIVRLKQYRKYVSLANKF
jgi:hypothetical protein